MLICMRTTVILNDDLVAKAREYTGINEKTRLIHLGLGGRSLTREGEAATRSGGMTMGKTDRR